MKNKLKIIVKSNTVDNDCVCNARVYGRASSGDEIMAQLLCATNAAIDHANEFIKSGKTSLTFLKNCGGIFDDMMETLTSLKEKIRTIAEQREYILGETEQG